MQVRKSDHYPMQVRKQLAAAQATAAEASTRSNPCTQHLALQGYLAHKKVHPPAGSRGWTRGSPGHSRSGTHLLVKPYTLHPKP